MRPAGAVLLAIAACSDRPTDAPARHLPTPAERAAAPPSSAERMFAPPIDAPSPAPAADVHARAQLTARWSRVVAAANCFFFSGPTGRDDQLTGPARIERDGSAVSITIGTAVFVGTFTDDDLRASRVSHHHFSDDWTVTETLRGRYREGVMTAAYHYAECAAAIACPGSCTIDGTLSFVR